jgi:hypothetical protein
MASYLVTATNGPFQRTTDNSDPDLPYEYGVDPSAPGGPAVGLQNLELSPDITLFMETTLDVPYPFTSSGGVLDMPPPELVEEPYALETQTRPMYVVTADPPTVAHEIAHQWFGNSVSPATWSDIWLNEGPAEFFSWLWQERETSADSTEQRFTDEYGRSNFDWTVPPAAPAADEIFNYDAMYLRGAMVMESLRQIVGEERFLELLKEWLDTHRYGHATTAELIALFKAKGGVSQTQLDVFFDEWLYRSGKPGITPENFATYPS